MRGLLRFRALLAAMGFTFAVDDVIPATEPPETTTLRERYAKEGVLCAGELDRRVLATTNGDGLLTAVHQAFADHRPLVLTPDAIWLTIARGVAHHVRRHSETLRSRLMRHEATRVIGIETNRFAADDPAWIAELLSDFRCALAKEVGEGPTRIYVCDFSTSTDLERMASEILLLDLYSPFVFYSVGVVCGIPQITVEGTPADWRAIRARIDVIEELDLGFWTRHLKRIADELVCAAEGRPDRTFFQRIYKPQDAYGEDLITGWVGWLYPYLGRHADEPNPLLQYEIDTPLPGDRDERGEWRGPHITPGRVPAMLGTCDVVVRDRATGESRPLYFEAGVGAVEVIESGALRPAAIWLARQGHSPRAEILDRNARIHALIDRIVVAYPTTPGEPPVDADGRQLSFEDELSVLYARLGSAVMGGVQLLPYERGKNEVQVRMKFREEHDDFFGLQPDLLAGRRFRRRAVALRLGAHGPSAHQPIGARRRDAQRWRVEYSTINASEVPIVARSLDEILDWILAPIGALPVLGTLQSSRDDVHRRR